MIDFQGSFHSGMFSDTLYIVFLKLKTTSARLASIAVGPEMAHGNLLIYRVPTCFYSANTGRTLRPHSKPKGPISLPKVSVSSIRKAIALSGYLSSGVELK